MVVEWGIRNGVIVVYMEIIAVELIRKRVENRKKSVCRGRHCLEFATTWGLSRGILQLENV